MKLTIERLSTVPARIKNFRITVKVALCIT
jgi:hypothetical protein